MIKHLLMKPYVLKIVLDAGFGNLVISRIRIWCPGKFRR